MKKIFYIIFLIVNFVFINNHSLSKTGINITAKTAILQDYLSGDILYEKEADIPIYPASMTKIMTTIIAFDLINRGEISLDEKFLISENAWRLSTSGYSSMFIMIDDEVSVENLLKGIIIASGNDSCVALAEGIAGSEEEFAIMMTEKAQEIGMENTNFSNSSGISDPDNYSTVRDVLIMSNYLIRNYPKLYDYFKIKEFTWDRTGGDPITQGNRNPLLYKNIGVDGIKTGYLNSEKYSLASSIKRGNRRLIAVGSGFKTKNSRSKQSRKLLIWGLSNFKTIRISEKNKPFTELSVWQGKKNKVLVHLNRDVYKSIHKKDKKHLKIKINYEGPIQAPIQKGDILGSVNIYIKDEKVNTFDLVSSENIKKQNIIARILGSINFLIWGDV